MNGGAMNCRQEPVLRSQCKDSSSVHNPGYHLQINCPQNIQPHHSKTLNYPSFSSTYQVDGYDNLIHIKDNIDSRHTFREEIDPRLSIVSNRHEPIDLPVPKFEIDEHSVSDWQNAKTSASKSPKDLDLDTRIDFLIKSKALASMHPIFSDLNQSEESESDLDDPLISKPMPTLQKTNKNIPLPSRNIEPPISESFDDPEKPLSRPPSPFLSRATYLFWFNKAFEIKQQAKAQEQALLELAAKRLQDNASSLVTNSGQDNLPSLPTNPGSKPCQKEKPLLKGLMEELRKELIEVIKEEFIKEVIEDTAFSTFDDWWERQNLQEKDDVSKSKSESEHPINNIIDENEKNSINIKTESQGSNFPKMHLLCVNEIEEQNNEAKQNENCNTNINHNVGFIDDMLDVAVGENTIVRDYTTQKKIYPQSNDSIKCDSEVENCVSNTYIESLNLSNAEKSCSKELKVVFDGSHDNPIASSSLSSDSADAVKDKNDEAFEIVKDIIDFIFNNVSNIVVQRSTDIENEDGVSEGLMNISSSVPM